MSPQAIEHLTHCDRVLQRVIGRVGPCQLAPEHKRSPFESLVRAIAHQQLHGRAAEAILRRFCQQFPRTRFPKPAAVLELPVEQFRAAGFSQAKVTAIRDLAEKSLSGVVPTAAGIRKLDDAAIIERLTQVRGVGRWTVEMLLIFQLGRPDVLPVDDFGLRNGFRLAYKLSELPTPGQVRKHGERWAPFRTTAAWYLWRVADQSKQPATKK
jgi:DNA-3-methyladenine glycosylase II